MLTLTEIHKAYGAEPNKVQALSGISIDFRQKEFVAILGPSGCGKTTLLNIIGGLDTYDSGSLKIYGHETAKFTEKDWDTYRNNSIGFVFQNYNLVPHLTILENVMLTLALVDVTKEEQIAKAKKVLEKVGLGEQCDKMPNQISGGQAQRVAIARALVNDPDIILADEPTGALDSVTSIQILDLLKELSEDHLIIMVTHNQELAEKYASRIVTMLDGQVINDTKPHAALEEKQTIFSKKSSMSFGTALKISAKNLFAKKKRTLKTCSAGAIALAGMTFCLSMSNAMNTMFNLVNSEVPLVYTHNLLSTSADVSIMSGIGSAVSEGLSNSQNADFSTVTVNFGEIAAAFEGMGPIHTNDLDSFYKYLMSNEHDDFNVQINKRITPIVYSESNNIYEKISPISFKDIYGKEQYESIVTFFTSTSDMAGESMNFEDVEGVFDTLDLGISVLPGGNFLESIYTVAAGRLPENEHECVLILTNTGNLSYVEACVLGLVSPEDLTAALNGGKRVANIKAESLIGKKFVFAGPSQVYKDIDGSLIDCKDDASFLADNIDNFTSVELVGVVYPHIDTTVMQYYPSILIDTLAVPQSTMLSIIEKNNNSELMQQALGDYNPLIGGTYASEYVKQQVLDYLGYTDPDHVTSITITATSEEANKHFLQLLDDYNSDKGEDDKIVVTDVMSSFGKEAVSIMDSVGKIVAAILAIALIVSVCMIGILLQVSVLERTKEIGLLRSIGASRKDIHRIFDAEAIVIGIISGIIGCGGASIFMIIVNTLIAAAKRDFVIYLIPNVTAVLILFVGNVIITYLAGRGPAKQAARVTPITALRSE